MKTEFKCDTHSKITLISTAFCN